MPQTWGLQAIKTESPNVLSLVWKVQAGWAGIGAQWGVAQGWGTVHVAGWQMSHVDC